ncbi:hypothetical protein [Novosphingobium sp. KN65.2]|uniref:hypothetical protein n=1 Tax=Novosphingobium sp. KN65.2 TaxID=1478134 RepID=UPI0005E055DE|nr:hypothetical protein [Novosphingobium sp. KN65.2]CDO35757.1 conserved hypothetical protein [Novosphingobium sp. KN65.2]
MVTKTGQDEGEAVIEAADAPVVPAATAPAGPDEAAASGKKRKRKLRPSPRELVGPSPNDHTNLAIADIALRGGTFLARRAVEKALLGKKYAPSKASAILKGRTMGETMLHRTLARVAMTSVPGAILVGGGLIAKTLYDRSKARTAKAAGDEKLADMAKDGEES